MTVRQEIERRLEQMSLKEYVEFREQMGGLPDGIASMTKDWQREDIARLLEAFDANENIRPRLCGLLGIPTPKERREQLDHLEANAAIASARAACTSASAAQDSANHAHAANNIAEKANRLSLASAIIAAVAALVAIGALYVSFLALNK